MFMDWKTEETISESGKNPENSPKFWPGVLAGVAVTLLVFAGIKGGTYLFDYIFGNSFASDGISETDVEEKLDQINGLIEDYYLYEDEIDEDTLIDGIYSGYAAALGDPYTEYYDEEETKALEESTSGVFSGIGALMSKSPDSDEVVVANVYEGSPAEKAGLQEGDVISQVDGKAAAGEDLSTVASWVKGEKGTEVSLHVLREGEELELTAIRDDIETQTVFYEMKDGQTGYIAVSEFDDVTYEQFETALNDLEAQGMEGLVIDLRGNPGGNLTTVTDMLKLLLPEGTIVSTKDKYGNTEEITCDGENEFTKPLAVLVNEYSASAAEIFSAAVQDYGTGVIVGTTTYGKGVVQQIIDLGDGTCLKLTIAEYYTPSGRSINGTGVEPDVEVEYEYNENDPEADNQLEQALETVREELEQTG
jgi:carboxyl-terminal processing protease